MKSHPISIGIVADHREKKSKVIEALRGYENVTVGIRTLKLGDYVVDDLFLFERKTLSDFITSIIDGRIFRRRGIRPKGNRAVQMHILRGFPGVGPKRARMLLSAFGSVEPVLNASADDLKEVGGVGKKTIENHSMGSE